MSSNSVNNSGDYLRVGIITGPHGINGRLKVFVTTAIESRFSAGNPLYVKSDAGYREYRVESFSIHKGKSGILAIKGVDDRNSAEAMKGVELLILKDTAEQTRDELDDDDFYYYDLIDKDVYLNDQLFGKVTDLIEAGSGNILIIETCGGREVMVPFVVSMVDTGKLNTGRIDIHPVEGLFDI